MLEKILPYERNLFFLINETRTTFLDNAMWLFSQGFIWGPLMAFFLFLLLYKRKCNQWLPVIVAIVILFVVCDQFSSGFCKNYFKRFRPTHHPDYMDQVKILYGYTGGLYGFISGHATNAFGFATFTALLFRSKLFSVIIFVWAFIMMYSRVYLGVHFISDVLAGAISGTVIGIVIYELYQTYIKQNRGIADNHFYAAQWGRAFAITIICYITFMFVFNSWVITLTR